MIFFVDLLPFKEFCFFPFFIEQLFLEEDIEVSLLEFKENFEDDCLLLMSSLSLLESLKSEPEDFLSFASFSIYNLKIELILSKA